MRKLISIDADYFRVSEEQLKALADELYSDTENDPSTFLDALHSLGDFELLGILRDELLEAPNSPLSIELRRRAKEICRRQAKQIAVKILKF